MSRSKFHATPWRLSATASAKMLRKCSFLSMGTWLVSSSTVSRLLAWANDRYGSRVHVRLVLILIMPCALYASPRSTGHLLAQSENHISSWMLIATYDENGACMSSRTSSCSCFNLSDEFAGLLLTVFLLKRLTSPHCR